MEKKRFLSANLNCVTDASAPNLLGSVSYTHLDVYKRQVFKAVAFFTYKYGKIDWLESNNEYWLMRDAALRTEFNITTGPTLDEMDKIKFKSCMKKYLSLIHI